LDQSETKQDWAKMATGAAVPLASSTAGQASTSPAKEASAPGQANASSHSSKGKSGRKVARCWRRTRRATKTCLELLGNVVYWMWDTMRMWDWSAGTGISSYGRTRISCRMRLYRWFFLIGGTVMATLLIVWNVDYLRAAWAINGFGLGILFGFLCGAIRALSFHNRWLCYRNVPKRGRHPRLVNVVASAVAANAPSPTADDATRPTQESTTGAQAELPQMSPEEAAAQAVARRKAAMEAAMKRVGKLSSQDRKTATSVWQVICW
jgi:hypothetical protein